MVKLIIGSKLNKNAFLYDFNLNKKKKDVVTDIKITIGIEKAKKKNTLA